MIYFIWKWENNGWMTVKGTPVRNRVLIEELDYYSKLIDIKWVNRSSFSCITIQLFNTLIF